MGFGAGRSLKVSFLLGRTGWVGRFQRPPCRPCLHGLTAYSAALPLVTPPWVGRFQRPSCRAARAGSAAFSVLLAALAFTPLRGSSAASPLVAAPSLRAGKGVSGSPGVRLCRPPVSPPRTGPRTAASGVTRPCPPLGRGRGFAPYALNRPTRLRLENGRSKAWAPHQGHRPGPGAAPPNNSRGRPTRLRLANGRPLERRFPAPVAVLAWPGLLRPRALIRAHATYSMRIQHSVCAYNMQHAACCMRLDYSLPGGGLPAPVPVWAISSVPVLLG